MRADPPPGVALGGGLTLPLGIVYRGSTKTLLHDAATSAWEAGEKLPRYAHVALTGAREQHGSLTYFMSRAGTLIAEPNLRVARRAVRPPIVPKRARWIHVSLADQTLVAYEGDRPVFATLVATGKQGYVASSLLSAPGGGADPVIIGTMYTTASVNLRSGPSTSNTVLRVVAANSAVRVAETALQGPARTRCTTSGSGASVASSPSAGSSDASTCNICSSPTTA